MPTFSPSTPLRSLVISVTRVPAEYRSILEQWTAAWPAAIAHWSSYVQLREPIWCMSVAAEKRESLTGSFAMIRLVDHAVVISLRQISELGLQSFSEEILAHEIGHHVYCPADLNDNARMLARMRRGLPGCEAYAPMVGNLYADLMINDRLERSRSLRMSQVYQRLNRPDQKSRLWRMYMRTYEILWSLTRGTLSSGEIDSRIEGDAVLASRLIRSYAKDWLGGAGRYACLLLPYVSEEQEAAREAMKVWGDAIQCGNGGEPDGLAEIDQEELDGSIHPAEDPLLSGLDPVDLGERSADGAGRIDSRFSGRKSIKSFREPVEYAEILKASGSTLSEREIAAKYYRERAIPFLIPFPERIMAVASDPLPEGLDAWDPSSELDRIDWLGTLLASPEVIPGVTTKERMYGNSPGSDPLREPIDLYLGVDCSGSMSDPAYTFSYPILAGTVIALSALRAGARVKVVLSGEPGRTVSTEGFLRDSKLVMMTLVNYLGTGYSFGIHRLGETFSEAQKVAKPTHVLVLSDYDMFAMLDEDSEGVSGWSVAKMAASACEGGATYVLQLPGFDQGRGAQFQPKIDRMRDEGWHVHLINSMEELVGFARSFSRQRYHG
ncbi:MAG: hypothetical protein ACK5PZ_05130 [Pirellula sp.]